MFSSRDGKLMHQRAFVRVHLFTKRHTIFVYLYTDMYMWNKEFIARRRLTKKKQIYVLEMRNEMDSNLL